MRTIKHYLKISWLLTKASIASTLSQKTAMWFFVAGKVIRFAIYFGFIFFLISGVKTLAGYNSNQVIFFFLTFNVIDVTTQLFFRSVYSFRPKIISGDFDLDLVKPLNPLYLPLMGWGIDLMDLITFIPLLVLIFYFGLQLNPSLTNAILFLILLVNSFLIGTAFHIIVLALAVIFLEVDHTIMLYRDLTSLGRFPVDIYKEPVRAIVTYVIPVGLMITIPARALMGLVSPAIYVFSIFIGIICLFASFSFWKFALKKYTSASS